MAANTPTPNTNLNQSNSPGYNTILVERHYIPTHMYAQLYGFSNYIQQPYLTTHNQQTPTYPVSNRMPPTVSTNRNEGHTTSTRYNDLMSFFNIQPRNTTHTEPLTSRVVTRTYETAGTDVNEQSFINMLMTAFYTPEMLNNTRVQTDTHRITPVQVEAHTRLITYSANVDLDTPSCSICTQEWQHGDEIRKLNSCRHYFHKSCVDTWFSDHNTCPLCRTNIIQTSATTHTGVDEVD